MQFFHIYYFLNSRIVIVIFIHVVASSLFFIAIQCPDINIYNLSILLLMRYHTYLKFYSITKNMVIDISYPFLLVHMCVSIGYIPRNQFATHKIHVQL